ncbi:hypothetical protein ACFYON_09080 [Micromonospora sp. NPDC005686]|uniref:hypothetical protein n=1 Tax=unclassified Micromonospora TaxID=2617518 RepID=UPI0033BDD58C
MILRFLAFRLTDPFTYAEDDFDAFLRKSMRKLDRLGATKIQVLREEFDKALNASYDIFGNWAFRKVDRNGGSRRFPINKALFEAIAVNLAALSPQEIAVLAKRYRRVEKQFLSLMSDVDFMAAISQGTGDPAKVRRRFVAIHEMFQTAGA